MVIVLTLQGNVASCVSSAISPGFATVGCELFTWLEIVDPKPSSPAWGQGNKGHRPKNWTEFRYLLGHRGGFSAAWFLAMTLTENMACTFLAVPRCGSQTLFLKATAATRLVAKTCSCVLVEKQGYVGFASF